MASCASRLAPTLCWAAARTDIICCAVHWFLEPDLSETLLILKMATVRKVIMSPALRSGPHAALEYNWAGSSRTGGGSLGVFTLGGIPAAALPSPPLPTRVGMEQGREAMRQSRVHISAHVEELTWCSTTPFSQFLPAPSPHQDVAGLTDGLLVSSWRQPSHGSCQSSVCAMAVIEYASS